MVHQFADLQLPVSVARVVEHLLDCNLLPTRMKLGVADLTEGPIPHQTSVDIYEFDFPLRISVCYAYCHASLLCCPRLVSIRIRRAWYGW